MSDDLLGQVETRIRAIIIRQSEGMMHAAKEISSTTPILGKGLGLDSIEALKLITEIEAEFGILVDDEELTVNLFENIGTLTENVMKKLTINNGNGETG